MFIRKEKLARIIKNSVDTELKKFDVFKKIRDAVSGKLSTSKAVKETFVYACLTTRAEILSRGVVCMYKQQGKKQIPVSNDNDFTRLLKNPNPFGARQTFQKFLYFTSLNLDISGNCLYKIQRLPGSNKITQLLPLIMKNVLPVYSADGTRIDHYQYTYGTQIFNYLPSEILHFKIDNVDNLLWGKPTIDSVKTQINIDYLEHKYLENYYHYDAVPNAILETGEAINDEELINKIRRRWYDRFRDWTMRSVPMVISNGMKYTPTQKDPRQSDLVNTRKQSKEDILSVLKIPPIVMGMVTMNYANAEAGLITMIENVTKPFCELHIESELQRFANDYFQANYIFKLDYDKLYDIQTLIKLWDFLLRQGVATRNEIRLENNRDENTTDPRMDEFFIPNNLTGSNSNNPNSNLSNNNIADLNNNIKNLINNLKNLPDNSVNKF